MGRSDVVVSLDPAIERFAQRLRQEIGAERVLLFGSQATGRSVDARPAAEQPGFDKDLAALIDHLELHGVRLVAQMVAGPGHWVYFERPDEFNRILDAFLSETGA